MANPKPSSTPRRDSTVVNIVVPPAKTADRLKRIAKWAALFGAVLALVCHFLPHDYRALCRAVASICTGG